MMAKRESFEIARRIMMTFWTDSIPCMRSIKTVQKAQRNGTDRQKPKG
jgi:hypothetical protein